MIDNIDRILEKGEKLELLVDKTDRLNQQAFKFEKSVSDCTIGIFCC
jgi:vesicle-associated membrane protein 7